MTEGKVCGAGFAAVETVARFAFGAVAVGLACGIHAAGLFLPVGPAGAAADVAPAGGTVPARQGAATVPDAWERRVRIARHELAAARADVETAGAGRLLLNVRDGARLDVVVERTAPTRWGYSLSGRVVGGSAGFATLVVRDEAVAASIWTPSASYELLPLGSGVHALRDVTNSQLECDGMLPAEPNTAAGPPHAADSGRGVDARTVVDVLVVYTQAAEEYVQRFWTDSPEAARAWIEAFNDVAVAWTNDAMERSGAFVSLNLLGIEKVDYEAETRDFEVLRSEGVRVLRDRLGADLVHATTGSGGGAAIGDGLSYLGAGGSTSNVGHEIGHSFGIAHERHEFRGSGGTLGYEHGFTTAGCFSTIMSYRAECLFRGGRQPFYASPWRYFPRDGRALGVTRFSKERGARGPADAVLTLNRNRHRIANLRPSRSGD